MYSRRFLSTTTAYKTVAGLLFSIHQLSNFNESKPSIVVNNTSLSPCHGGAGGLEGAAKGGLK
jgi:hypothetical protein